MKDRFVAIDPDYRDLWEKKYQLPFGYGICFISLNQQEVIDHIKEQNLKGFVVEKINTTGREIVWRQ